MFFFDFEKHCKRYANYDQSQNFIRKRMLPLFHIIVGMRISDLNFIKCSEAYLDIFSLLLYKKFLRKPT